VVAGRIVLFGATGYTGEFTARALAERGARPVLAGRDGARLRALAAGLGGLETRVADAAAPRTLDGLVERGDVLISTVGPFLRLGEPAVHAAVAAGAHYLDSTGETAFIRRVFDHHGPAATTAGSALLTAFGYDWVPGNLAGALALRDAGGAATRVAIGYFVTGTGAAPSGGTRASAAGVLLGPSVAWRGGRLVTEPVARRVRSFDVIDRSINRFRRQPAFSVGGSEHLALPRVAPGLREVGVYLGWFGPLTRPIQAFSRATSPIFGRRRARGALDAALRRYAPGSTGGPGASARARTGSFVVAEALDDAGTVLATARLTGPNPYDVTAGLLAWGAMTAAAGGVRGAGALGPVDGFGIGALQGGCAAAGLTRV
jgi:short subunit dehydrogenase-like uncharacterized protein